MEYEYKVAMYIDAESKNEADKKLEDIVWRLPYRMELLEEYMGG